MCGCAHATIQLYPPSISMIFGTIFHLCGYLRDQSTCCHVYIYIYIYVCKNIYIYIYNIYIYMYVYIYMYTYYPSHSQIIQIKDTKVFKTIINHPPTSHRWYKLFPVMAGLWHCFTHMTLGLRAFSRSRRPLLLLPPPADSGRLRASQFRMGCYTHL